MNSITRQRAEVGQPESDGIRPRTGGLAILFPAVSVPAFITLVMLLLYGIGAGMITAVALAAAYGLWAALDAQSFQRWIAQPVRQRFQMWWRYTRTWEQVCALHGLTARRDIADLAIRFTPPKGHRNANQHNINDTGPDGSRR